MNSQPNSDHLFAEIGSNGRFGFVDTSGNIVIPFIYNYADSFSEGLAAVADENNIYGYINPKGETVIPHQYIFAAHFSEGLAAVEDKNNRFGYINAKGETVIPHQYTLGVSFHEGIAIVKRKATDKNVLFLDTSGKALHLGNFSSASYCCNGTIAVEKNGQWGIIDKKGNVIIDFIYDHAHPFDNNGIACVMLNEKTFEITRDGEEYIQDL